MTKTVSARITNQNHKEILERCNRTGCAINEWLNECITYLLTGSSDFDFGDNVIDETEVKPGPIEVKVIDVE